MTQQKHVFFDIFDWRIYSYTLLPNIIVSVTYLIIKMIWQKPIGPHFQKQPFAIDK